jgi:hypothetical protein
MKPGAPVFYTDRSNSIDVTQYLGSMVVMALQLETNSAFPA